jgi:hypothetical protein
VLDWSDHLETTIDVLATHLWQVVWFVKGSHHSLHGQNAFGGCYGMLDPISHVLSMAERVHTTWHYKSATCTALDEGSKCNRIMELHVHSVKAALTVLTAVDRQQGPSCMCSLS